MALIFNIQNQEMRGQILSVGLVGEDAVGIAAAHQGHSVALGVSDVAGIWSVVGSGTLAGSWSRGQVTYIIITELNVFPEPFQIVTDGDSDTDSVGQPYGMDTLSAADAFRILGVPDAYEHMETPRFLAAEDTHSDDQDVFPHGARVGRSDNSFVQRLGEAYLNRCAFTGLSQFSLDGRFKEGIAIGADGRITNFDAPLSRGLFVSRSIGFCYRHGLLAVGEDYDILRHPELGAEFRVLLEITNRRAKLFLPEDEEAWPDLRAARRHRQRFGY